MGAKPTNLRPGSRACLVTLGALAVLTINMHSLFLVPFLQKFQLACMKYITTCLPTANEVCGKVMFLRMSVILSTGGHAWPGGVHGRGHAWWGVCVVVGHVWWGHAWPGGAWQAGMHGGDVHGRGHDGGMCGRACVMGGMHGRGLVWQGDVWNGACMAGGMHGRRDGHCSGPYASYRNAFLFYFCIQKDLANFIM